MRTPHDQTPANFLETGSSAGTADPLPDRKRLESDVRAFLRQPSTPWITYDKVGRYSHLSAGDALPQVLPVARSSILSDHGVFPADLPGPRSVEESAKAEPSSLVVAKDLEADEANAIPVNGLARAPTVAAASGVAAVALALAAILLPSSAGRQIPAATAQAAHVVAGEATDVPPPPPLLDPRTSEVAALARPPATSTAAATVAPSAPSAPQQQAQAQAARMASEGGKGKFGKLTIRGEARHKHVYFDGKRMLGSGARSFATLCGTHTIAVEKGEPRELEVPCAGELVVTR